MTANDLRLLEEAGAAFAAVLQGVKPGQMSEASSCAGWSVKDLTDHVISGNLRFASLVSGASPTPDGPDDDPTTAFRASMRTLTEAFSADGVLDRTFQTPMGERSAPRLVATRIVEMSVHGWDLARSTEQVIDLPGPVADAGLAQLQSMLPSGERSGLPFGSEQQAPEGASPADRLAAFAGRKVT